ncbi:hypothetical protein Hanom_Chr09g00826211 [Helianthus anomalus]
MVIGPGLNPGPGPGPPVNRVSNDDCGGRVITTGGTWRWCCGVSAMRFLSLRDGGMFGKSSWWLVAESWKLVAGGWKLVAVAGS